VEIVKLLLAEGADPNAETNEVVGHGKCWAPLKIAEANGFKNLFELLQKSVQH
jgi:hypothetical protein